MYLKYLSKTISRLYKNYNHVSKCIIIVYLEITPQFYAYISFRHVYMLINGIVIISAGTSQSILWMGYMQTSLRSSAHVQGHLKRIL